MKQVIKSYLEPVLFPLLWLSFFLPGSIQTVLLIVWTGYTLLTIHPSSIPAKRYRQAFLLTVPYWFYLLWLPLTVAASRPLLWSLLERKFSLLLFPALLCLGGPEQAGLWRKTLYWFAIGAGLYSCFGLYVFLNGWIHAVPHWGQIAFRIQLESLVGLHPVYTGMYLCMAFVLFWSGTWQPRRAVSFSLQVLYAVLLLLLFPKTALCTLSVLTLFFLRIWQTSFSQILRWTIPVILLVILVFIIPFSAERWHEFLLYLMHPEQAPVNSVGLHHILLHSDLYLLRHNWLWGLGPVHLQESLDQILFSYSLLIHRPLGFYNTHCEYLNQWLCFGLPGLFTLTGLLTMQARKAIGRRDHLHLAILFILAMAFLTENILSRQQGVVFYALLTTLFYFYASPQISIPPSND